MGLSGAAFAAPENGEQRTESARQARDKWGGGRNACRLISYYKGNRRFRRLGQIWGRLPLAGLPEYFSITKDIWRIGDWKVWGAAPHPGREKFSLHPRHVCDVPLGNEVGHIGRIGHIGHIGHIGRRLRRFAHGFSGRALVARSVLCSLFSGARQRPFLLLSGNFTLAFRVSSMVSYWDLRMGLARHDPTPCCFAPAEPMRAGRPGPPDR